ncbi:MAG: sugar phosphotransferase [Bacteroidetes bacterium]|nr:sugar phosphotransferase [Bacteroidota bacterium]
MQEGDEKTFPYGAFLSWENLWHGWGNLQSYALLKASTILNDDRIKIAALKEINNFYQYLYEIGFMNEFKIKREGDNIEGYDMKMFSQIAYIIRPIIFAYISAYEVMGDSVYAVKAGRLSTWFFGNNNARQQMYFSESGKCFDGINDEDEINKNSGAESTIEALLSILAVENNSYAKNELLNYLNKKIEIK